MPQAKCSSLFVMLYCLSRLRRASVFCLLCSHCMFIYTVCLLAFIFLLRIQVGKTSSSFHSGEEGVGCEGNEFLQMLLEALS